MRHSVVFVSSCLLVLAACSTSPSDFKGTLSSPQETGVLVVSVGGGVKLAGALRTATPSLTTGQAIGTVNFLDGRQVSITGSYDPVTGALSLTGTAQDGTYTLNGTATANGISGAYTGPKGNGTWTVLPQGAGGEVEVFCGTYDGDSHGVWNVVVFGSDAAGVHCGEDCGAVEGTLDGANITLNDPNSNGPGATGTRSGDTLSGTWSNDEGTAHGTWTGSKDACNQVVNPGPKTPVSIVPGLNDSFDFAVTDTAIYMWTGTSSGAEIHTCDIGGCGISAKVAGPYAVPSSVAANGTKLTWAANFRTIFTCDTAGGCSPTEVIDTGADSYPVVVRQTATTVYWHSQAGNGRRVEACELADCATTRRTVLASPNALDGLSLSDVAWVEGGLLQTLYVQTFQGGLFRFTLVGGVADVSSGTQIANTGFGAAGIFVDGDLLLRTKPGDGKVVSCAIPDCNAETDLATGLANPVAVAANANATFILSRGTSNGAGGYTPNTGQVWMLAK